MIHFAISVPRPTTPSTAHNIVTKSRRLCIPCADSVSDQMWTSSTYRTAPSLDQIDPQHKDVLPSRNLRRTPSWKRFPNSVLVWQKADRTRPHGCRHLIKRRRRCYCSPAAFFTLSPVGNRPRGSFDSKRAHLEVLALLPVTWIRDTPLRSVDSPSRRWSHTTIIQSHNHAQALQLMVGISCRLEQRSPVRKYKSTSYASSA